MNAAAAIVIVVGAYAVVGLIFGAAFVARGVSRVDHSAQGAPIGFRMLILPGAAALWPWLLVRWVRAGGRRA